MNSVKLAKKGASAIVGGVMVAGLGLATGNPVSLFVGGALSVIGLILVIVAKDG